MKLGFTVVPKHRYWKRLWMKQVAPPFLFKLVETDGVGKGRWQPFCKGECVSVPKREDSPFCNTFFCNGSVLSHFTWATVTSYPAKRTKVVLDFHLRNDLWTTKPLEAKLNFCFMLRIYLKIFNGNQPWADRTQSARKGCQRHDPGPAPGVLWEKQSKTSRENHVKKPATRKYICCCSVWHLGIAAAKRAGAPGSSGATDKVPKGVSKL